MDFYLRSDSRKYKSDCNQGKSIKQKEWYCNKYDKNNEKQNDWKKTFLKK